MRIALLLSFTGAPFFARAAAAVEMRSSPTMETVRSLAGAGESPHTMETAYDGRGEPSGSTFEARGDFFRRGDLFGRGRAGEPGPEYYRGGVNPRYLLPPLYPPYYPAPSAAASSGGGGGPPKAAYSGIAGALGGAAVGALIGFAIGGPMGAVMGALVGALLGILLGALFGRRRG